MPLTSKGETIKASLEKEYGAEKGERVLYAGKNAGTFTGIDDQAKMIADACQAIADQVEALHRRMDDRDARASREDASKQSIDKRVATYRKALEEGKITVKEFDAFMEALAREGSGRTDSEIDDIKDKLNALRMAGEPMPSSLIRRLEELRNAGAPETEKPAPKTLGEMFTSAGATRKRRDDARKEEPSEKFSFTNPDVPLFGAKYQETKRKAEEAMENLRRVMENADKVLGGKNRGDDNADYSVTEGEGDDAGKWIVRGPVSVTTFGSKAKAEKFAERMGAALQQQRMKSRFVGGRSAG